ncbi:hypothetical protein BDZ45DRAFT_724251 [Acephala macrosclerotiorum]|nr:hypothetical protein BDZ45DRAFT_724251 [Acephala macrosclerotiorum]
MTHNFQKWVDSTFSPNLSQFYRMGPCNPEILMVEKECRFQTESFQVPYNSTTIDAFTDLLSFTFAVHFFSLVAYAAYPYVTLHPIKWRHVFQWVALRFFPMLPYVYIVRNLVRIAVRAVVEDELAGDREENEESDSLYDNASFHTVPSRLPADDITGDDMAVNTGGNAHPSPRVSFYLAAAMPNTSLLSVSFALYAMRLHITYGRAPATYVTALGLDYRVGWLEIGALMAMVESLIIHDLNFTVAGLIQNVLLMATNRYGTLTLFQAIIVSIDWFFSGIGILLLIIVAGVLCCR